MTSRPAALSVKENVAMLALFKKTPRRNSPYRTSNGHTAHTHKESHEYIYSIIIQKFDPTFDSTTAFPILFAVRAFNKHLWIIRLSILDNGRGLTFFPPLPSTTLPVRLSTTLAWNHPPRALSNKLPIPPHKVIAPNKTAFSPKPQPLPPSKPGWFPPKSFPVSELVPIGQNGNSSTETKAIVDAPKKPAMVPRNVIPPLVPGGTSRKLNEVNSRGLVLDKMPSSEENVSAATAA